MSSFCSKCGNTLQPNSAFCSQCGAGRSQPLNQVNEAPREIRSTQPIDPPAPSYSWMQDQPQAGPMVPQQQPQHPQHAHHGHQQQQQAGQPYQQCPFCKEMIQAEAIKCRFCGEIVDITRRNLGQQHQPIINQNVNVSVPVNQQQMPAYGYMPTYRQWSPGLAAFLSFLIPGLGQIYKGQVGIGIIWFICVIIGYALFVLPGLILHVICIATAASGDPYRR